MGPKDASCSEAPTTLYAQERPFVTVNVSVFREIVAPSKLAATVRTLVSRLPVQSHVHRKGMEHFATNWAQLQRFPRVTFLRGIHWIANYFAIHHRRFGMFQGRIIRYLRVSFGVTCESV